MTPPPKTTTTPTSATRRTPGRNTTPLRMSTPTRRSLVNADTHFPKILFVLSALVFLITIPFILKNVPELECTRIWLSWYLNWTWSGFIGTLGFSPSSNTWLYKMGPFIARVTSTAYICKSTSFDTSDLHNMTCSKTTYDGPVSVLSIFTKVILDVLSWAFGTALAEFAPFYVGTLFAFSLRCSKSKLSSWILGYLVAFQKTIGQTEALLLASLPNPLIETTGLVCGLLHIDSFTFLQALLLGKVLIRGFVQTLVIIILFSKDIIDPVVAFVQQYSPAVATALLDEVAAQRQLYQQPIGFSAAFLSIRTLSKLLYLAVVLYMIFFSTFTLLKTKKQ